MNRGGTKWVLTAAMASCVAGLSGASVPFEDLTDDTASTAAEGRLAAAFDGLAAREVVARDRAEHALAEFLRDPSSLLEAFALADRSKVPEVQKRFARAVVEDGRTFGALLIAARVLGEESGAAESDPSIQRQAIAAEDLMILSMESILAWEGPPLLQKGELDDRAYVFKEGLLTGLRFPLGPAVPFSNWVDWLGQALPAERPLVVDPRIDLVQVPAVETIELLPTTADALLVRVLSARGLGVLDLGVAFVIVKEDDALAFRESISAALDEPSPEDEDDGATRRRERRSKDRLRARWLVNRLLDPVSRPFHCAPLVQAVAPAGAREALVDDAYVRGSHYGSPGQAIVSSFAAFGVNDSFDSDRLSSFFEVPGYQAVAFRDLVRRPKGAAKFLRSAFPLGERCFFGGRLAANLQHDSAEVRVALGRALSHGSWARRFLVADQTHSRLMRFEIAPLDPQVRADLVRALKYGTGADDLLRIAIQGALILAGTEEDSASSVAIAQGLLESTSPSARVIGAAVAGSLVSSHQEEPIDALSFGEVAKRAGIRGAEAWLLAKIGSPLADETLDPDLIASGLAMDLTPSVEAILRAHAFRSDGKRVGDQVKAAAEDPSGTALAALVLEAIRDSVHDGYRASFLKSAVGRLPKSEQTAAIVRELSEVLRAAEPGAEIIWLDPRRRPPYFPN